MASSHSASVVLVATLLREALLRSSRLRTARSARVLITTKDLASITGVRVGALRLLHFDYFLLTAGDAHLIPAPALFVTVPTKGFHFNRPPPIC